MGPERERCCGIYNDIGAEIQGHPVLISPSSDVLLLQICLFNAGLVCLVCVSY